MSALISSLLAAALLAATAAPQAARVSPEDMRRLTGARWTGTLTYTDYGTNRRVSIPSNLTVTESPEVGAAWVFEYEYPKEPKANGKRTLKLGEGGSTFDGETVVERTSLDDGTLKLVTEKRGTDNERAALFRFTYLIGASSFSVKKEVRHEGAPEFFERNVYSWSR